MTADNRTRGPSAWRGFGTGGATSEARPPRAVELLVASPFAEGDYYPGDLLSTVLRLPDDAWQQLGPLRLRLAAIVEQLASAGNEDLDEGLRSAIHRFSSRAARESLLASEHQRR